MGPHLYLEWQGRNPSTPARVESANILTESNIRDLVRLVDEELDGVAHEQRRNLETIEGALAAVRRWLERLYRAIETTDLDLADLTPRIKEHRGASGAAGERCGGGAGAAIRAPGGPGRRGHHHGLCPGHERLPHGERPHRVQGLHQVLREGDRRGPWQGHHPLLHSYAS